jgi:hypothetical protein
MKVKIRLDTNADAIGFATLANKLGGNIVVTDN